MENEYKIPSREELDQELIRLKGEYYSIEQELHEFDLHNQGGLHDHTQVGKDYGGMQGRMLDVKAQMNDTCNKLLLNYFDNLVSESQKDQS